MVPRYKIEIWRYHAITEVKESDDINALREWYHDEWQLAFDWGECSFEVYDSGRNLTFEEVQKLGFYDEW